MNVSLQRLKHTESDRLQVQIQAYLDNVFDVGTLLEDAETKTAALERVEELEENLSTVSQTAVLTCLVLLSDHSIVLTCTCLSLSAHRCLNACWMWRTKQC